ncbi:MAG: SPOR domain-containing protein [Candidatus Omnitrophota bacterium]
MMNANSRGQQIEFDVFPKQEKSDYSYLSGIKEDTNRGSSSVNLVLSSQSVIILFICIFLLLIASFTLGVEKGKLLGAPGPAAAVRLERQTQAPEIAPAQNLAALKPAAQTVTETQKPEAAAVKPEILSGYVIQVASLKSEDAARGLAQTLDKKGIPSFVKASGKYSTVLAGTFASREEAQGKLKELKKTYSDCYIKKI